MACKDNNIVEPPAMASKYAEDQSEELFMKDILPEFNEMLEEDEKVCRMWKMPYRHLTKPLVDVSIMKMFLYLAGSANEGAFIAPMLKGKMPDEDICSVTKGFYCQDDFEPDPSRPGTFRCVGRDSVDWINIFTQVRKCVGQVMIARFGDVVTVDDEVVHQATEDTHTVPRRHYLRQQGPSVAYSAIGGVSVDHVQGHQIDGWPQEAEEWRSRKRCWPDQDLITEATEQGYWMIAKVSKDNPEEYHWVMTFTKVENILAENRNPTQKLVYLIAKTIFYFHLDISDSVNPKHCFPSYALKTCFMWLMEETPKDLWILENTRILLQLLFQKLFQATDSRNLPNYFLPHINILRDTPQEVLKQANDIISRITKNVLKYIPTDAVRNWKRKTSGLLNSIYLPYLFCTVALHQDCQVQPSMSASDDQDTSHSTNEGEDPGHNWLDEMANLFEKLAPGSGDFYHNMKELFSAVLGHEANRVSEYKEMNALALPLVQSVSEQLSPPTQGIRANVARLQFHQTLGLVHKHIQGTTKEIHIRQSLMDEMLAQKEYDILVIQCGNDTKCYPYRDIVDITEGYMQQIDGIWCNVMKWESMGIRRHPGCSLRIIPDDYMDPVGLN